jgi:3-oxoacyl-[acyl-carrier-protein] synthase-3
MRMAYLAAFGSYLPERVVANAELAAQLGCDADWIVSASGIRERRWAAPDESVANLAAKAGRDCLSRAHAPGIGLVLVASGSAERQFPGPAAETAAQLGLLGVPAVDIPMASAGSLFAMDLAARACESAGDVLVIAAEKMSAVMQRAPMNRDTAILFGDGAGACLVSAREGKARWVDSLLQSDGSFTDALRVEYGEPLFMDGRTVILHASRKIPAAIKTLLDRNGVAPGEVAQYILHQANANLMARVAQALGAPRELFFSNIDRYGNTSSASMLIAASEWSRDRGFEAGKTVVFAVFGAGFHWGAALARC